MEDHSRGKVTAAGLGGRGVVDQARIEGEPGTADEDGALPTGRQLELRRGGVSAVVTEVGATLRALEVGGLSILQGFPADGMPEASRGQVLIPFPNRVDRGRYAFHGRSLELPLDEPDRTNAMQGLVLHARDGYPFVLSLRVAYTLTPSGLCVRQSARNLGAVPASYGAGFHPY